MKTLILLAALMTLPALALETDNYLVWNKSLSSSEKEIDSYLNSEMKRVLDNVSRSGKDLTCEQVTDRIGFAFQSYLVHNNPIENWLFKTLKETQIYPQTIFYNAESIYRNPFRFYLPKFGLAPSIMVNDIYFGTDKLSHFASTGFHYYVIYRTLLEKLGEEGAEEKAILYGATDEKMVHGYWSSGVFSFADLEANYQGLKFYRRFCAEKNPYLEKINGIWELVRSPSIRDFVGPLWDESYNVSYFLEKNWEKVSPVIKELYCPQFKSPKVLARFGKYALRTRPSYSNTVILKLQVAKAVPVPQSIPKFCLQN